MRLTSVLMAVAVVSALLIGCHNSGDNRAELSQVSTAAPYLRGDMDGDGTPSINDAIAILRVVVGLDAHNEAADADGDGSVGVNDAIAVLRCVVGLADWPLGEWRPPPDQTLAGTITVTDFIVPEGQQFVCAGDVVIQCETATVTGEIYSAEAGPGQDGHSITVEAQGDIVVTGEVRAGNGGDGISGAAGGAGGELILSSTSGDITVGVAPEQAGVAAAQAGISALASGDGGDGGDGLLGGPGGDGGSLVLVAAGGTITLNQSEELLALGDGGNGGLSLIAGQDLLTFTPPEQVPSHGGRSGHLVIDTDTLLGMDVVDSGETYGGKPLMFALLDDGVLVGGKGGDGGDYYCGIDPITEESTWPAGVGASGVRANVDKQEEWVRGADGGDGDHEGGKGGDAYHSAPSEPTPGDEGMEVSCTGGDGGDARYDPDWRNRVADAVWGYFNMHFIGGNGGTAHARGGNGTNGGPCGRGSAGGFAFAHGGNGGDAENLSPYKAGEMVPGNGGYAYAGGGSGGNGGVCCDPTYGKGGDGGWGTTAGAWGGQGGRVLPGGIFGAGGDAKADGGDGGHGAQGNPGGSGGGGGLGRATPGDGIPMGTATSKNGRAGLGGSNCTPPGEPPPDPPPGDVITGKITDRNGRPSPNTMVTRRQKSYPASVDTVRPLQANWVMTDEEGRFTFVGVPAGECEIWPARPTPPDYLHPAFREVTKEDGVGVGDQNFTIYEGGQFSVTVYAYDRRYRPVEGVRARLIDTLGNSAWVFTDEQGVAVFENVWSGWCQVTLIPPAEGRWSPAWRGFNLGERDELGEIFVLAPD